MDLGGLLGGGLGFAFGGLPGAALGASIGGGMDTNAANRASAESAQTFSANQYASRWQTTVKDMEAAGLNPMLAYSQGVGNAPTGNQYQAQNPYGGVSRDFQSIASAGQSSSQSRLADTNADKIKQEIENMPKGQLNGYSASEWNMQILRRTADMLKEQAFSMQEQGYSTERQRDVMTETIRKIKSETSLLDFDVKAAAGMGNIGREAGQLKPIIDLIVGIMRAGR